MKLTPQGSYLYSKCYPLYNRFCRAIDNTKNINDNVNEYIRIGCLNSYSEIQTTKIFMRQFQEIHPESRYMRSFTNITSSISCLYQEKSMSLSARRLLWTVCRTSPAKYRAYRSVHRHALNAPSFASRENVLLRQLSDETFCILAPEVVKSGTDRLLEMCI